MEKATDIAKNLEFDAIKIGVASPEKIMEWSYGEVTRPETINYRTQKPERDGLFCEKIFGPTKDWECYCGKYKKIRYKGVVCDKCGVEVTRSSVRRERMGHVDLAVPVTHIWYLHGMPSVLSTILDISVSNLEKVVYFASYIILDVDEEIKKQTLEQLESEYKELKADKTKLSQEDLEKIDSLYKSTKSEINSLQVREVISEAQYIDYSMKYGQILKVGIGAEAILQLLKDVDFDKLLPELEEAAEKSMGVQKRRIMKRMHMLKDMQKNDIRPEWLVMTRLPIIPPDLRPMVQLDGGRFAASDLNDLYRRVINRNNRLKRLLTQGAPEVITRNEKRMLQEAVDALIDNSARKGKAVTTGGTQRRLKSLSDMLRGKQGRFRQNLLGKRVDYSGRSVIVVGPELKLHQCGLPKVMALELFKPFVISKLIEEGYVHNVKNATRLIEKATPEVWDILERITSNSYVLLNRAPTLHRLGIQAFQPVLIEGKAIQLHPSVCYAFNADFDGDQMAVHVPLSSQARAEAETIMKSAANLLKPASGEPVITPKQDIVLGIYYLTSVGHKENGEGRIFGSAEEAILAYQNGVVSLRALIKTKLNDEVIETTVGRIIFNNILPEEIAYVNEPVGSSRLQKLFKESFARLGIEPTAVLVDKVKDLGFEYASRSGITISIQDINIPGEKTEIMKKAHGDLEEIDQIFRRGLLTDQERRIQTIDLWNTTKTKLEKIISQYMSQPEQGNNPIAMMIVSKARGSMSQLTQMAGMKGLVVNPAGDVIEIPLESNFKEGLSVLEYFISTHGARKGKSDTSIRTSDAGYLTRRLVDVAQDVVIHEHDCGTKNGVTISREESNEIGEDFNVRIAGRVALNDIVDPKTKKAIVKKNDEITDELAKVIADSAIEEVQVRSVLECEATHGVCQLCYGRDLATGKIVAPGTVVGIMAAQAIGEPGTQLTMQTFHVGGIAHDLDITSGLPRVEELFEARPPKNPAIISELAGTIQIKKDKNQTILRVVSDKIASEEIQVPEDYKLSIQDNELVKVKQAIAVAPGKKALRSPLSGMAKIKGNVVTVTSAEKMGKEYELPAVANILFKNGDQVEVGDVLTEGHLDLNDALKYQGLERTQKYILRGIQEIYSSQGQTINDKHVETILREMFSKLRVLDPGDSDYLEGQVVDKVELFNTNKSLAKKKQVVAEPVVMGISRVALKTDSFLSAASFQETTRVLIDAAIRGAVDDLSGLKENVIIGKLVPAGTAYKSKE